MTKSERLISVYPINVFSIMSRSNNFWMPLTISSSENLFALSSDQRLNSSTISIGNLYEQCIEQLSTCLEFLIS